MIHRTQWNLVTRKTIPTSAARISRMIRNHFKHPFNDLPTLIGYHSWIAGSAEWIP